MNRRMLRRIKMITATIDHVVKKMNKLMRPTTASDRPRTASGETPNSVGLGPADPVDPVAAGGGDPVDPVDPVGISFSYSLMR
jgi:hypothetical protein